MKIVTTTSSFWYDGFPDGWEVVHNPHHRRLNEDEVDALLSRERPDGIIAGVEPLTRRVLERCESLSVISRCGVGLDSVDLAVADELGIGVSTTPESPVPSVAEHALTLMLCLLKRIAECEDAVRLGLTGKPRGRLLAGKTVGIIGCGRIGTKTAELLRAFGCSIVGFDPYIESHELIAQLPFNEVLGSSDVVTLHVPLLESTRHLIDAEALRRLRPDALLINTSRGGIVDEAALYEALRDRRLAAAGLDVFEHEPYEGPLTGLGPRVLLTPHVASSAAEARDAMEREAVANLVVGLQRRERHPRFRRAKTSPSTEHGATGTGAHDA